MIPLLLTALLAAAHAQDATPDDDAPPAGEVTPVDASGSLPGDIPDPSTWPVDGADAEPEYLEVLVIGEQVISAARDDVVRKMKDQGWRAKRKRDGRILFRGPEAWMGKATLMPTGDLNFTIPALALDGLGGIDATYDPSKTANNDVKGGTVGASFSLPAGEARKVRALQGEVYDAVKPQVDDLRNKLAMRSFSAKVSELPERLDALWERGESLDGGSTVTDPAKKRAQVLDYWSTRTDTPEGRTISRTVEIWLRQTVMDSADPVTPEEAAAAEERRNDGRRLDVFGGGSGIAVEGPDDE